MNHDQFRLLIFEVLEHHLTEIEDSFDSEQVNYHADRCRWAAAYLKKYTKAVDITEDEINFYLNK